MLPILSLYLDLITTVDTTQFVHLPLRTCAVVSNVLQVTTDIQPPWMFQIPFRSTLTSCHPCIFCTRLMPTASGYIAEF
jgi:hypothetical protein